MKSKVLIVYSYYYDDPYIYGKIKKFKFFFDDIIIISNRYESEFHAYFSIIQNYDYYLICNDTIFLNKKLNLIYILNRYIDRLCAIRIPILIGDYYKITYQYVDQTHLGNNFIRSDIFAVNKEAYEILRKKILLISEHDLNMGAGLACVNIALFNKKIKVINDVAIHDYVDRKRYTIIYERRLTRLVLKYGIVIPIRKPIIIKFYEFMQKILSIF